jgi:hypothetical protein
MLCFSLYAIFKALRSNAPTAREAPRVALASVAANRGT